jgi:anti-sigma factor RsiW
MTSHLSPDLLDSLADGELSSTELAGANEHLSKCPACTSSALFQSLLKSATAKASLRYTPTSDFKNRIATLSKQQPIPSNDSRRSMPARLSAGFAGWAIACSLLLVLGAAFFLERRNSIASSQFAELVTEICDQHVAVLASGAAPQVLSSDRHTVKPWFQGKLPFSFNLPENLPNDTKLEGANLTYLHGRPAALLLYGIGKHRASVFVRQRGNDEILSDSVFAQRSGFHVDTLTTKDLDLIAVSDVDQTRLNELVNSIKQAQVSNTTP